MNPLIFTSMKKKKEKSASVKMNVAVFNDVREYCVANGVIIGFFVSEAAKQKLEIEKQKLVAK